MKNTWNVYVARGNVSKHIVQALEIGLATDHPDVPDTNQFVIGFDDDFWLVGNRRTRQATIFNSQPTLGEVALAVLPDPLDWPYPNSQQEVPHG